MGDPTAATLLCAAVGWVVAGVVPGWLVASAWSPGRALLDRVAVAPAISLGLAYSAAVWVNRLGFAVALQAALISLAAASLAATVTLVRRRRSGGAGPLAHRDSLVAVRIPLVLALLPWVVAMGTSAAGWSLVVPDVDGNTHGLLAVALLHDGTVLGFGGYPLAAHLVAALVGSATSVPSALVVPLTLLGSVWTVLGVASLARRVSAPSVGWVAAAALAVPYFPFGQVAWGPLPLVLAVALVPGVALAVLDVSDRGTRLVAAVSVAGLLATHVTEALVAALLVLLVLLCRRRPFVRPFLDAVLVGVAALVLTAPLVAELVSGGAARPQDPSRGNSSSEALASSLFQPFVPTPWGNSLAWACAVVAGAVLILVSVLGARRVWSVPYGRATVLLVMIFAALAVLARMVPGGLVTSPWYGNGDRLVAQCAALLPVLLGAGLAALLPGARGHVMRSATAIAVTVCLVAASLQGLVVARQGLGGFSVVSAGDRCAFAWLARHAR